MSYNSDPLESIRSFLTLLSDLDSVNSEYIKCPECGEVSLRPYIINTTYCWWWFCTTCCFSGDTTTVYSIIRNISKNNAKNELKNMLEPDQVHNLVFPPELESNLDQVLEPIRVSAPVQKEPMTPRLVQLFANLNIYSGDILYGIKGRYKGVLYKYTTSMGEAIRQHTSGPRFSDANMRHGFVLPLEYRPGIPSGWVLYGSSADSQRKPLPPVLRCVKPTYLLNDDGDYGLYGLQFIQKHSRQMYIMPSPLLALRTQLQVLAAKGSSMFILGDPGVGAIASAYTDLSELMPAIIWTPNITPRSIDIARTLRDASIMHYENSAASVDIFNGGIINQINDWHKNAVPWVVALADKLYSMPVEDAVDFLMALKTPLTQDEQKEVLFAVEHDKNIKNHIEHCFNTIADQDDSVFTYNNRIYTEKNDEWWDTTLDKPRKVSNVTLHLYEEGTVNGESITVGDINYRGNTIPFTHPTAKLKADAAEFVQQQCMKHVDLDVEIDRTVRKDFYNLARARHEPTPISMPQRIGWSESGRWVFPSFNVIPGGMLESTQNRYIHNYLPCHGVAKSIWLIDAEPLRIAKPTYSNEASDIAFTVCICLLARLLGDREGVRCRNIGIVNAGSMGEFVVREIVGQIGLQQHRSHKPPAEAPAHGVPSMLLADNIDTQAWRNWLRFVEDENRMLFIQKEHVPKLLATRPWDFIDARCKEEYNTVCFRPHIATIPYFLARHKPGVIPTNGDWLENVGKWMLSTVAREERNPKMMISIDRAVTRLKSGPTEEWARVLWCVFAARAANKISVHKLGQPKPRKLHVTEDDNGNIMIPWTVMRKVKTLYKGNIDPDVLDLEAVDAVQQAPDGWIVNKDYWQPLFIDYLKFFRIFD